MYRQDVATWLQQVPARGLLALEQEQLTKWMPLVRGATVLQLGGLPQYFPQLQTTSTHYYYVAPRLGVAEPGQAQLVAGFDELPLKADSVDLVLLVHLLEVVEHPTVLLKEVFDALAPNGKLLLFCLNRWSLGYLQQLLGAAPSWFKGARGYSPAQLQRWLSTLGFSNLKDKTLGFCSLNLTRTLADRSLLWTEALGQLTIPMLGSVNVFLVEKRVYAGLTALRYDWQQQAQRA